MIGVPTGPGKYQVRGQMDRPCGRPGVATILGVRLYERCTREQTDLFALGELTQVPRGESSVAEGAGYAARSPRLGYSAGTRGARRGPVAKSAKISLLLIVASILLLAATACSGAGQASEGSAATEAKAKPETAAHEHARPAEATAQGDGTRGAVARVGDAGGAVARAGGAVARADNAQAQAGDAAREKHGGEAPGKNAAGEDSFREDRLRESHPQELTLEVGGDPGTGFSGLCSVGEEGKTIGGRVPQRYVFELGDAGLECEIHKKEDGGTLQVVAAGEGVRSVQHTGATEGTIRFAFSERGGISQSTSSSISLNQTATT